jgi:hypothetical protein
MAWCLVKHRDDFTFHLYCKCKYKVTFVPKRHRLKVYGEVEVKLDASSTSVLDGGEALVSSFSYYRRIWTSGVHRIGGWMVPRDDLVMAKRKSQPCYVAKWNSICWPQDALGFSFLIVKWRFCDVIDRCLKVCSNNTPVVFRHSWHQC